MIDLAADQPRRGRPPKVREPEQVQTQAHADAAQAEAAGLAPEHRRERRRKDGEEQNAGLRLAVPDWVYEKYPRNQFKVRWLIDEPGRINQKHKEDWDRVENVPPVPGATDLHGNPANHVLFVKRMEWVLEDRALAEERRKEIERQMERGKVTGRGDDAGANLAEDIAYADEGNRLR